MTPETLILVEGVASSIEYYNTVIMAEEKAKKEGEFDITPDGEALSDISPEKAQLVQQRLAPSGSCTNAIPEHPTLVAGVDISPPDANGLAVGVVALLSLPNLEVVEVKMAKAKVSFPYIPGLLAFREAPLLMEALSLLETPPDFVLVGGHGLAHPRRFGLACHMGVLTGLPTVGCALSMLVGAHDPLKQEKGAVAPLSDRGETIGVALRTKDNTRPVYVSIGHRVDLDAAVRWTLACCTRYRIPEPLRAASQATKGSHQR